MKQKRRVQPGVFVLAARPSEAPPGKSSVLTTLQHFEAVTMGVLLIRIVEFAEY